MALVQKQFGDLITFTRSSAGGRFNERGLFEMVPANQPRFDYDPVTKLPLGLLIEGSRTNLLLRSSNYSTLWAKNIVGDGKIPVVTPNTHVGPDGLMSASTIRLEVPDLRSQSTISQQFATVDGQTYSGSIWIKANRPEDVGKQILMRHAGNVAFMTLTLTENFKRAERTEVADRAVAVFQLGLRPELGGSSGAVEFVAWESQVEQGLFATSNIPTTATQVTRTADAPTVNNLSPWFNPSEGTILLSAIPLQSALSLPSQFVCIDDGTLNNRMEVSQAAQSSGIRTQSNAGGKGVMDIVTGKISPGEIFKSALAYKSGDYAVSVNGGTAIKGAGDVPTGLRLMVIGSRSSLGARQNCCIQSIRYYSRRLSNSELEALTK